MQRFSTFAQRKIAEEHDKETVTKERSRSPRIKTSVYIGLHRVSKSALMITHLVLTTRWTKTTVEVFSCFQNLTRGHTILCNHGAILPAAVSSKDPFVIFLTAVCTMGVFHENVYFTKYSILSLFSVSNVHSIL